MNNESQFDEANFVPPKDALLDTVRHHLLPGMGCEVTALDLSPEVEVDIDQEHTDAHLDDCGSCQRLEAGISGLN
jgi:hypothetical protein